MRRIIVLIVAVLILIGGWVGWQKYRTFMLPSVPADLPADTYLKIPVGATWQQVVDSIQQYNIVNDIDRFTEVAERLQYKRDPMRSGRFKITPGWNNLTLVRHLRNGQQATVKVVLNNENMPERVAAKVATFIEPDSVTLWSYFQNEDLLQKIGYTPETLMSLFIPNTYDFFWNTTPEKFIERMQKEHDAFWAKNNRLSKAEKLNLSPAEVYTLASIVEKETNQISERPRMAGVYLNRLRTGMLLQADPTSVFATKDFGARRVTNFHTQFDSPYNTYMYPGLPPGPIAMASIASIDAVLNAEDHDYVYFCAVGDGSGLHNFARTLRQHNQNAARYRKNLRNRGLR